MYRIREVAQILGFTERAVRQWVMDGKIKAVRSCPNGASRRKKWNG